MPLMKESEIRAKYIAQYASKTLCKLLAKTPLPSGHNVRLTAQSLAA
jgi:hypothetical protein